MLFKFHLKPRAADFFFLLYVYVLSSSSLAYVVIVLFFNIPPTHIGKVPTQSVERLHQMNLSFFMWVVQKSCGVFSGCVLVELCFFVVVRTTEKNTIASPRSSTMQVTTLLYTE